MILKLSFFIPFVAVTSLISARAAADSGASASSLSAENSSSTKAYDLNPSITLTTGASSNVGKLQQETPGAYARLSPTIEFEFSRLENIALTTAFSADLKSYTAPEAKTLGDESKVELRNMGMWFINENWEIGGDLGAQYAENRIAIQLDSSTTTAEVQRFTEPEARIYASWTHERTNVETGIFARNRIYSTDMEDRGNVYRNDFHLYGSDLKLGYEFSEAVKVALKGQFENRIYSEKPADFSDGAPSNISAPLPNLQESSSEISTPFEYRIGKARFVTAPAIRFNKDLIYGARDSQTLKFQQKLNLPVSSKLNWSPSVTMAQESFDRFRSDPQNNPFGSPLRRDVELKFTSPLKYTFSKALQISAEYSFAKRDSNYADSSYIENAVSTAINYAL